MDCPTSEGIIMKVWGILFMKATFLMQALSFWRKAFLTPPWSIPILPRMSIFQIISCGRDTFGTNISFPFLPSYTERWTDMGDLHALILKSSICARLCRLTELLLR